MEGLAPSYQFLLNIRLALENGVALRTALINETKSKSDEFHQEVRRWLAFEDQAQSMPLNQITPNAYRRCLFQILSQGLRGQPVHAALIEIEEEWDESCRDDVERHLQKLPILMLLPLLFLQFPAFLLLLLGPIIGDFLESLHI